MFRAWANLAALFLQYSGFVIAFHFFIWMEPFLSSSSLSPLPIVHTRVCLTFYAEWFLHSVWLTINFELFSYWCSFILLLVEDFEGESIFLCLCFCRSVSQFWPCLAIASHFSCMPPEVIAGLFIVRSALLASYKRCKRASDPRIAGILEGFEERTSAVCFWLSSLCVFIVEVLG